MTGHMRPPMPPMNLHWKILGRPVKPVAFGLMFSMMVIGWAAFSDVGVLGKNFLADFLGGAALMTAAVLASGWYRSSQMLAELGLLMASIIWALRFWLIVLVNNHSISTEGLWLSIGWVVIASGSYLLEKADSLAERPR